MVSFRKRKYKTGKNKELREKVNLLVSEIREKNLEEDKTKLVSILIPHLKKIKHLLPLTEVELQSATNWVLTKLLNKINSLDKDRDILSYISIAVKNFCIDEYRKIRTKKKKEVVLEKSFNLFYEQHPVSMELFIEDIADTEEEALILTKIVLDRQKPSAVARDLGIKRSRLKSILEKTRNKLLV